MRKQTLAIGALILFLLASCGTMESPDDGSTPEPTPPNVKVPVTPQPTPEPTLPEEELPPPEVPKPPQLTLPELEATVTQDEDGLWVVTNPEDHWVLVNKTRHLSADYEPGDLVYVDIPFPFDDRVPWRMVREEAAQALERLVEAAREEGHELYGLSGYRSYQTQRDIFQYNVSQRGEEAANRFSARPGQSEHQTGWAMDVTIAAVDFRLVQSFGETPEGRWVANHAPDFGFIIRYPEGKEDITGYAYEPWHLRYVGREMAQAITESGLTMEEYAERPWESTS